MGDYRQEIPCKKCGYILSGFESGCPGCAIKEHDDAVKAHMDLYRRDPEEAFRALTSMVLRINKNYRRI